MKKRKLYKGKYRWYFKLPGSFYASGPSKLMYKYELLEHLALNYKCSINSIEIWRK